MYLLDDPFQRSWEASDAARHTCIGQQRSSLTPQVEKELGRMEQLEKDSFFADLPALEKDIAALLQRAKQFSEGVQMWQYKAQVSVDMIEEKQRTVAQLVEEAAIHLQNRSEALLRHQQHTEEEARLRCGALLQQFYSASPEPGR